MKLIFFGRLRDAMGTHELEYSIPTNVADIEALRQILGRDYPALLDLTVRLAVDDVLVGGPTSIAGVREIAFLPPVSGG